MDKELKNMKLKLSLLSVILISVMIFVVGASFLIFKYYSNYNTSLIKIKNYEKTVNSINFNGVKDFKNETSFKPLFSNFFILFDDKGNLIYNNSPFLDKTDLNEFLNLIGKENLYEDDSYLIHNFKLNNNYKVITLFFLSYSQEQLIYDLIKFLIIIFFISIGIYFIISRFISYLLKPIDENYKGMKYFVQVASHELKTPLSVISSSVQMMKQTKKYDEETINEIVDEIEKSDKLVNRLFELYNINNLSKKEETNVSEVIYEVLRDLNTKIKEKNIKVKIDFINEIIINTDRYYLYMLVSNLISNAVKYNKENGKINIIINKSILKINDTGVGISDKDKSKIFDIFYRVSTHRNVDGLGLGLAIVKKITDTYGWKIRLDSKEDTGTEFEIIF